MELQRGAEALILREEGEVLKQRLKKGYRLEALDESIRNSRTRREARILKKLSGKIPVPKVLGTTDTEIRMEFIDGTRLADTDNLPMKRAGEIIATMHDLNVIHGDLTTSNMILAGDLNIIDFGLAYTSARIEDRAVDVHLLKEALEAKHYKVHKEAFEAFKEGYKKSKDYKAVMERLKKVEARGRYKGK